MNTVCCPVTAELVSNLVSIKHLYHDMKRVSVENNGNLWWAIKDEIHRFKEISL